MIIHRIRGISSLLGILQGSLLSAAFWVCFGFFCLFSRGTEKFTERYALYWAVVLACFSLELLTRGPQKVTAPIYDSSLLRQAPISLRQVVFSVGGLLLFLFLTKGYVISRVFVCIYSALLYALLIWSNSFLPSKLSRWVFSGTRRTGTLLVGPGRRIAHLSFWLERKKQFGVSVVGHVATDETTSHSGTNGSSHTTPIAMTGKIDQLEEMMANPDVSQVILMELASPPLARRLIRICQQRGLRLLIVNDFAELLGHPIISCLDEGVNILTLHEEPLENPFNRLLKRMLDLVVASAVVVLVLPWLVPIVWIFQRLQSPGPLWHRQTRAGIQNKAFLIFKFRTMHTASGEITRQASADDQRIFPAGRWMRRLSIDEVPQFLNVLIGDMSVVGPRPHLIEHNTQFAHVLDGYHFRTFIKPGITGLAQVRGFRGEARTRKDIAARLASDMVYLENWSLTLDLGIIMRTAWQVISPPKTAV